jgi:two-component system KDP operon response regulator KdpE
MPDATASPARRTFLIIEDEPKIRAVVRDAVAGEGDEWCDAGTASQGLFMASANPPDLVILDLGLPDMPGIDVCRRLRSVTTAPILVLSARLGESEKAALLDAGADDYVTKPFGSLELRARVHAQLRRARIVPAPLDAPMSVGGLSIDLARRSVMRDGVPVHLTRTEWGLLNALVTNAGRTLTHRQLYRSVWGDSHGQPQQYLRVYITHLRKKIESDAVTPRVIVTEPGVGYRFEIER